jgi:hypothetical protein
MPPGPERLPAISDQGIHNPQKIAACKDHFSKNIMLNREGIGNFEILSQEEKFLRYGY